MMRVFVAGASGAIGTRLVPQLQSSRARGDRDLPVARATPSGCARWAPRPSRSTCSTPARCARPCSGRRARTRSSTRRPPWRTCSSRATSTAASRRPTGCGPRAPTRCSPPRARRASSRFVAQSFASARYARVGGPVKTEDDPLDPTPAAAMRESERGDAPPRRGGHRRRRDRAALRRLLRRRQRWAGRAGAQAAVPDRRRRRRRLLVHPPRRRRRGDRARARTRPARASTTSSTTSPRRCASGCPVLARVLAPSRRAAFPRWLARLFAGDAAVMMGTESRGASNAKAKRELGWQLRYPSWRQGFAAAYAG